MDISCIIRSNICMQHNQKMVFSPALRKPPPQQQQIHSNCPFQIIAWHLQVLSTLLSMRFVYWEPIQTYIYSQYKPITNKKMENRFNYNNRRIDKKSHEWRTHQHRGPLVLYTQQFHRACPGVTWDFHPR